LLKSVAPPISGALLRYASGLLENELAQTGSNATLDSAFSPLRNLSASLPCASARDLERFGDALLAASSGPFSLDFYRFAYLCYAAYSFHGELPLRLSQKLAKCEHIITDGSPDLTAIQKLAQIALSGLQAGADDISYSALLAAVSEAQKFGQ
jgi:hypothetical protein